MLTYAMYLSSWGWLKMAYQEETLLFLKIVEKEEENFDNQKNAFTDNVWKEVEEYFLGQRQKFSFAYRFKGTDFQKRVWEALAELSYGTTCTYQDLAQKIGKAKAVRAVGSTLAKNSLWFVVPCHRVVGRKGLGGYAGGLALKERLLSLEQEKTSF